MAQQRPTLSKSLTYVIETDYPINFREKDAEDLGKMIKNGQSAVLIGMKRVGISNFLRFFIYHPGITKTYIKDSQKHLFIPVDLNDLIERAFYPFWVLTLKRITDSVQSSNLDKQLKKDIETLFLDSIQSKDLFLLIEAVRKSINKIIEAGALPTIFFIRFDRLRNIATTEFLYNLEGLKRSSNDKLSLVFTTYKRLDQLNPKVFSHTSLSLASNNIYLKPGERTDLEIITETYLHKYNLKLDPEIKKALFELVDGYVQYMQLGLIILQENTKVLKTKYDLFNLLVSDERVSLQSEELWDSLALKEKDILLKINAGKNISAEDKEEAEYLFETGIINKKESVFSPLFSHFLNQVTHKKGGEKEGINIEFSKKEHLLFIFLQKNINQICEREAIIEAVWPEEEALGVSDWAIDRLVARVRNKLKQQNNKYEIVTVKTRGYKLITT